MRTPGSPASLPLVASIGCFGHRDTDVTRRGKKRVPTGRAVQIVMSGSSLSWGQGEGLPSCLWEVCGVFCIAGPYHNDTAGQRAEVSMHKVNTDEKAVFKAEWTARVLIHLSTEFI